MRVTMGESELRVREQPHPPTRNLRFFSEDSCGRENHCDPRRVLPKNKGILSDRANVRKINVFSLLLHVASFCFHACSKSYPRRWRGFSGSLFGAVVKPTRPKNHQKTKGKSLFLAFCSMLLHFASMLVPRAILWAGVAFWALFLEPLSTQLAPKIIKTCKEKRSV